MLDSLKVCYIQFLDSLYATTEIDKDRYTLIEQSEFYRIVENFGDLLNVGIGGKTLANRLK